MKMVRYDLINGEQLQMDLSLLLHSLHYATLYMEREHNFTLMPQKETVLSATMYQ